MKVHKRTALFWAAAVMVLVLLAFFFWHNSRGRDEKRSIIFIPKVIDEGWKWRRPKTIWILR